MVVIASKKAQGSNYIHNKIEENLTVTQLKKNLEGSFIKMDCVKQMVGILQEDELDKLGEMRPPAAKSKFVGDYQGLAQTDIQTDAKYWPKGTPIDERVVPHLMIHIESGNIEWSAPDDSDLAIGQIAQELDRILEYSDKFDCTRMAEERNIFALRYVTILYELKLQP
jgi:hypothetical protein